jgi:NADH:ubiquinone reductase (H+-translocating)
MNASTKHSVSRGAKHVVVLGAGYAGMVTALRCSGQPGGQIRVTVVNPADQFVERVRLHQAATGRPLRQFTISKWLRDRPADLVVGLATDIDPDGQKVMVHTGSGTSQIPYDVLVYATGSVVDLGSVPGASDHAHSLADKDAADRLLGAPR